MPCHTSARNRSASESKPSGMGNLGIRLTKSNMPLVSTRSAISSWLLRQPSCHRALRSGVYISGGGLRKLAGAVEPEPVRVSQGLAGLDAQQHVVGLGVRF